MGSRLKRLFCARPKLRERHWNKVIAVLALYVGLGLLPPTVWYELYSLQVSSGKIENLWVKATRDVKVTHEGTYRVTVRKIIAGSGNSWPVYTTSYVRPFTYERSETRTVNVELYKWLGSERELGDAKEAGFGPGRWELETCHIVTDPVLGLVPDKKRCVKSNIFEVHND